MLRGAFIFIGGMNMLRVIVIAVAGITILGCRLLWEFCRWIDDICSCNLYGGENCEKKMQ